MDTKNYFRFRVYGDNWRDLSEESNYVFLDYDNKFTDTLSNFVWHFIAMYNLSDLELFFRLAGFSAFTLEEMPDYITNPKIINLPGGKMPFAICSTEYLQIITGTYAFDFGKIIESELETGIIERYQNVKKSMLANEMIELRSKLKTLEKTYNSQVDLNKHYTR